LRTQREVSIQLGFVCDHAQSFKKTTTPNTAFGAASHRPK